MNEEALDATAVALMKRLNGMLACLPDDDPSYIKPYDSPTDGDACLMCAFTEIEGGYCARHRDAT